MTDYKELYKSATNEIATLKAYCVMYVNDKGEDNVLATYKTKARAEEYIDDNIEDLSNNLNSEIWIRKMEVV